jgi:DNA-binding NtrC family response regulator
VLKVLLVDDDNLTLAVLTAFLVQKNFEIKSASDGLEGLKLLENEKFDLVISDVNMAQMDGITFLKTLREKGNAVPFIIITGHASMDGYIDAVQKLGAFEYVQKPVELDVLHAIIMRLLEKNDL